MYNVADSAKTCRFSYSSCFPHWRKQIRDSSKPFEAFWDTTKKCENQNLVNFYFNTSFLNAHGRKG